MKETRLLVVAGCACLVVALWNFQSRPDIALAHHFAPHRAAPAVANSTPLVGIVFKPQDCAGLIDALSFWNEPERAGEIRVVGLLRGVARNDDAMRKIVNGAGLRFPVHVVEERAAGEIRSALGYSTSSLLVVFDRHGQVRMTAPLQELSSRADRDRVLAFARTLQRDGGSDAK